MRGLRVQAPPPPPWVALAGSQWHSAEKQPDAKGHMPSDPMRLKF